MNTKGFVTLITGLVLMATPLTPAFADGETVPGVPTNVQVAVSATTAIVMWQPPETDGGFPITSYTVTANPSGKTCTNSTEKLECRIKNLEPTVWYTFSVIATNQIGNSEPGLSILTKIRALQFGLVHFGYRSHNLGDHAKAVLRKLARTIHDGEIVRVLGFTQTAASWNYTIFHNNMVLARQRAEEVRDFLKQRGVDADFRLKIFGPTRHVSWKHQELNRRVVLFIKHVPQG